MPDTPGARLCIRSREAIIEQERWQALGMAYLGKTCYPEELC